MCLVDYFICDISDTICLVDYFICDTSDTICLVDYFICDISDTMCLVDYFICDISDTICLVDYFICDTSDTICLVDYFICDISDTMCLVDYFIWHSWPVAWSHGRTGLALSEWPGERSSGWMASGSVWGSPRWVVACPSVRHPAPDGCVLLDSRPDRRRAHTTPDNRDGVWVSVCMSCNIIFFFRRLFHMWHLRQYV